MLQPGRKYEAGGGYRYGFNGKENDNEVKGEGNQQDYGMRVYDSRLGRFLSVDPIAEKYPMLTAYQFASNTPIQGVDMDGLELLSINSSMYRSTIRSNHPKGFVPPPIPFTSDLITEQTIVLVSENISSEFKDAHGVPFGILNININKFKPQSGCYDCPSVESSGGGILPASPPWPWGDDYGSENLEPSSSTEATLPIARTQYKGTGNDWHYWEYAPVEVVSPIGKVSDAANEAKKYVDLFTKDMPIWEAYIKMAEDGAALHLAIQKTNAVFEANVEPGNWFNGLQNKSDFANYILDGTLPSSLNFENGKIVGDNYDQNLLRRLNIQFYGILILKQMGNNALSSDALNTYKQDIESYERTHPGAKHNWREAYQK
jgi:RHS repeat-associated protein